MKTVDDLIKSRSNRKLILAEFGEIPESILRYDRTIKATDLEAERRSYASMANDGGHIGALAKVFDVSGQSCRGEGAALSRFPQNVGRKLLLLYTNPGDVVIDPFAGHNSRMELCWRSNRHYVGCDVSKAFMAANAQIKSLLLDEAVGDLFYGTYFTAKMYLVACDARHIPLQNEVGDFTITSPPYWDLEYYGDETEQLGTGKSYTEFLDGLQLVASENFRCLKRGAFCVWCVNDFRKRGTFYSYHEAVASILRMAGFIQFDIAITDLGPTIRAAFATQVIESRILPKRHEYCLIFQKPE